MSDDVERDQRRQALVKDIRDLQVQFGHISPVPAFLNLITDKIIDIELRLEKLENA